MLRVRKEQLAVFSALAKERFEVELTAHLRQQFPRRCEALGDEALAGVVSHASARGKRYGFITEQQVASFAGLLVLLGRDLDESPRPTWVTKILNDESFLYPSQKLEALWDEVDRRELDDDGDESDDEEAEENFA